MESLAGTISMVGCVMGELQQTGPGTGVHESHYARLSGEATYLGLGLGEAILSHLEPQTSKFTNSARAKYLRVATGGTVVFQQHANLRPFVPMI